MRAEFGITKSGFIEVHGYTYTLHDVFEELEHPAFPQRLNFHKQLWKSPQILHMLEKNSIDIAGLDKAFKPFCGNPEFDKFFSPYFAGPFNHISRTLLAKSQLTEVGTLLASEEFLLPAEREEAFRPIRIFLDENLRLIRNTNGENYKLMRPKIAHWIYTDWHLFFNNLPGEFYDLKNDMIARLVNIGVAVQKSHRRDCKRMSKQLVSLQDIPESLNRVIVSNHAVYTGSSGSSGWRNIFWIGWVIFMLAKGASSGCNGGGNTTYRELDFPKYKMHDSAGIRIIDSIIKKNRERQDSISVNKDDVKKRQQR